MGASLKILSPEDVAASSQIPGKNIYILGTFDNGVTVLNQQTRALNLAWALVEKERVPSLSPGQTAGDDCNFQIAVIGAGFAGLTVAAGLISKGVKANVTLFEQRDTLLPLQHGSDTRWLHPHIYNWPDDGSESSAAMLPVLNWTAARASDVVVQALTEWNKIISTANCKIEIFCNTRHLQVSSDETSNTNLTIEWIGEARSSHGLNSKEKGNASAVGKTDKFDLVIVATGFGLEKDNALSYWRNDRVGQPNLKQARQMYLVSGQGDGAMIDLLRVRISHFRQDRILAEVFGHSSKLTEEIKCIYKLAAESSNVDLFSDFERLEHIMPEEFKKSVSNLSNRLRRDTDAILHLKVRKISELFNTNKIRMSFQNKILIYFLYKCGGFVPSTLSEGDITQEHNIPDDRILKRHGTDRLGQLKSLLSEELYSIVENHRDHDTRYKFQQTDKALWSGGYFGFYGVESTTSDTDVAASITSQWRKEYLPGPTELVATSFCSSLAGFLKKYHPSDARLRVTLHRAINFGSEEVLQQCCEYFGVDATPAAGTSAGRAFPADNATIGLAYRCRRIIRSVRGVQPATLEDAMQSLRLRAASGKMVPNIHFILAVPILEPAHKGGFIGPNPVAGVIYIDSTDEHFFLENSNLKEIVRIANELIKALEASKATSLNRIRNIPTGSIECDAPPPVELPPVANGVLEVMDEVAPPSSNQKFEFNFDYSDFIRVGESHVEVA